MTVEPWQGNLTLQCRVQGLGLRPSGLGFFEVG